MGHVIFILFYPNEWCVGGCAARPSLLFLFPCSADHERGWPPRKIVFFGLAANMLNVRNNDNNNNSAPLAPSVPAERAPKSCLTEESLINPHDWVGQCGRGVDYSVTIPTYLTGSSDRYPMFILEAPY